MLNPEDMVLLHRPEHTDSDGGQNDVDSQREKSSAMMTEVTGASLHSAGGKTEDVKYTEKATLA